MKPLDFIGTIELAYDRTTDEATWLETLTQAMAPAFSIGLPTTGYFFDLVNQEPELGRAVGVGDSACERDELVKLHDEGRAAIRQSARVVYECDMLTLLSRVVGPSATTQTFRSAGVDREDALGLRANATADSGVVFTTFVPHNFRIRQRGLWTRFASHVGAALRLRRLHAESSPETARAVMTPRGKLEHGTEATLTAREDLTSAAEAMDRARGKLRRLDPAAACAIWRAMVRGEWTLVDWVDHDGKRFLLAHDNPIQRAERRALTRREQQVVACAAMGHSNKLIAYDLGLSTGTVSVLLGRAAKKLGVSGRVALIRAFREDAERLG